MYILDSNIFLNVAILLNEEKNSNICLGNLFGKIFCNCLILLHVITTFNLKNNVDYTNVYMKTKVE